jgi:hypothetical protein
VCGTEASDRSKRQMSWLEAAGEAGDGAGNGVGVSVVRRNGFFVRNGSLPLSHSLNLMFCRFDRLIKVFFLLTFLLSSRFLGFSIIIQYCSGPLALSYSVGLGARPIAVPQSKPRYKHKMPWENMILQKIFVIYCLFV